MKSVADLPDALLLCEQARARVETLMFVKLGGRERDARVWRADLAVLNDEVRRRGIKASGDL